jgi:hypothetical protein
MRRRLGKLALAMSILMGGLMLGASPRPANAIQSVCPQVCCDPGCTLTHYCYPDGLTGGCVCDPRCVGY